MPAHETKAIELFYNTMIRSVLHYVSTIWTSSDKDNLGRVLIKVTEKSSKDNFRR